MDASGCGALTALLHQRKHPRHMESALQVLRQLVMASSCVRQELAQEQFVSVICGVISDRSQSEVIRHDAAIALHGFCTHSLPTVGASELHEVVSMLNSELQPYVNSDSSLPNYFVASLVSLSWLLVKASPGACRHFLLEQGVTPLYLHHTETSVDGPVIDMRIA